MYFVMQSFFIKVEHFPLPIISSHTTGQAFAKRPDMVTVAAEKTFDLAKVNYINNYASLSTFPGRIAQNDHPSY